MNGKLLFLDIDGTLTEPGYNTPPESALKAIKMAQKNGHKVTYARRYFLLLVLDLFW